MFGKRSLTNFNNLAEVNLPKVRTIGRYAFSRMTKDEAYRDNKTVWTLSEVATLGESAFRENKLIEEINLPELVKSFSYSFYVSSLSQFTAPKLENIPSYMFNGASNLRTFDFHNIKSLGSSSFSGTNITEFDMPELTDMAVGAFYDISTNITKFKADKLETISTSSDYHYNDNIFGRNSLTNFNNLAEVNLPKVKTIGRYAFSKMTKDIANIKNRTVWTLSEVSTLGE
ncbi:UNVERIFIED_CONTAM: leucine-rich repeat protein [Campylobacter lari]